MEEQFEEKEEREKRKNNIVIVNIPESDKETNKEREIDDITHAASLLNKVLEVNEEEISNPIRIGKKREGNKKPRMLKLTITSEEKKKNIIKNAYQLNLNVKDPYKRVYINNDLTPMQRDQEHRLRDELRRRKADGETNLKIRSGKIVREEPKPTKELTEEEKSNDRAGWR